MILNISLLEPVRHYFSNWKDLRQVEGPIPSDCGQKEHNSREESCLLLSIFCIEGLWWY